jgi:hypothetical protein
MDPEKLCLLRNVSSLKNKSFIRLGTSDTSTEAARTLEGCYLYFDTEAAMWIRSGKVAGRTFGKRHIEHRKSSQLKCEQSPQSDFYTSYPSKTATAASAGKRRGFFDDLTMYCGLAFSSRHPDLHYLQDNKDGIFLWDNKDCLNWMNKGSPSPSALNDKKLHMVAYLCELGYDLMLAPGANISKSPGFERPLGAFQKN